MCQNRPPPFYPHLLSSACGYWISACRDHRHVAFRLPADRAISTAILWRLASRVWPVNCTARVVTRPEAGRKMPPDARDMRPFYGCLGDSVAAARLTTSACPRGAPTRCFVANSNRGRMSQSDRRMDQFATGIRDGGRAGICSTGTGELPPGAAGGDGGLGPAHSGSLAGQGRIVTDGRPKRRRHSSSRRR